MAPVVGRTFRLLLTLVIGVGVLAYATLSVFAGRPLPPFEAWTFGAAVLRATPAHIQGGNPVETLRVGGQAFGSPLEDFMLAVDNQAYTLPLPPHTALAESAGDSQRFITFATGEELQTYFGSTLLRAGWRHREQLGRARMLEREEQLLSVDVKFYRGTRIRELRYNLRPSRAGLAPPPTGYPRLTLSPPLRARFAALPAVGAPRRVHAPSDLLDAAKGVVGFLRGEIDFNRVRLADTVTLYLGLEAGGVRREVRRAALRDPRNWKVRLDGARGHDYSLVPPKGPTVMTTRIGRHFRCRDHPLSSVSEELARFPHVGVLFTPPQMESCLQAWNFTLVFDPNAKPPTLVAVVYDQFEW
jgi:hypothetical protein